MTIFGSRDTWAIEVDPLSGAPEEPDPAAAATWSALQLWAGGTNLTAHTRLETEAVSNGVHWPAAFLARWFITVWDDFWARSGWPLRGLVVDPRKACAELDQHVLRHDEDLSDEFLDRRDAFVRSHTLLAAAAGGVMPHVYLMREGRNVHVVWHDPQHRASPIRFHSWFGSVRVKAASFLDVVRGFVEWCRHQVGENAPEFTATADAWLARIKGRAGAKSVLDGYIHPWAATNGAISPPMIESLLGLPSDWTTSGALVDVERYPAAIVYRALAPAMSAEDVSAVLKTLRSSPARPAGAQRLEALCKGLNLLSSDLPHDQGQQLAAQVRERIGNTDRYLDIDELLNELLVDVQEENLSDASVDAATAWGPAYGPVIMLNSSSPRDVPWARRMSLAHELCHLLVDRSNATEVMVASTPWAPPEIEKRANAFAAELLLPKAGMIRALGGKLRTGWITDRDRLNLMSEFRVGDTVCGHQLKNRLMIGSSLDD